MLRHIHSCVACLTLLASPTVTLRTGDLEGVYFGHTSNEVAFLGVPYAAPPVGELRWKPPQPVAAWTGTRKATTFGASCPQLPQRWLPDLAWNEDCLHLSIWTTDPRPTAKRPVIVWLHGGGNKAGRSHYNLLGPELSRLGVVFVAVNYRLGPFGFLAHPLLTAESDHHASGNYGLLDQLQALRWVRDNIARVGGDPGQVTVMGHSAGAVDACLLMTSPLAAGLFQRAILHSGECQATLMPDIHAPLRDSGITDSGITERGITESGEDTGRRLARALDVPTLAAARQLSAETILNAWRDHPDLAFGTIVDGWVVPDQPARIFAARKQLDIPVIVGSTTDEATIFNLSSTKAVQLMTESFGFGAWSLARAVTRAGQRAYLYSYSYATTGKRASLGAFHGAELIVLSHVFPDDWERSADDDRLGDAMRRYWVQFAKTGDPNVSGLPRWQPYDASSDRVLDLGRTIAMRPAPKAPASP